MKTNKLTIIFSGMAGSGKSSLARAIAKKYGLAYVAGGDILKEMAKKQGYKISGDDWWETPDGIKFLSARKKDFSFDKELDKIMLQKGKRRRILPDIVGNTLAWREGNKNLG